MEMVSLKYLWQIYFRVITLIFSQKIKRISFKLEHLHIYQISTTMIHFKLHFLSKKKLIVVSTFLWLWYIFNV